MLRFEEPAIRIENVTKEWGSHVVLNNLNFDIAKGKITTILGFSGAGKSTLMKHILRLVSPTRGRIIVLGEDVGTMDYQYLRDFRCNFGMLFQYAALFDSLSALKNVMFPMKELTSLGTEEIHDRAIGLLKSVGLREQSFHKLPGELSGGMRKRVGLARALALKPKIMLYDEPTTGLDPITKKMVNDLIVETAQKNQDRQMTSIIISHDVRTSLNISDFVAFLDRGTIVEYQTALDFKNSENPLVQEFIGLV